MKVYNFVTDADFNDIVTTADVNLNKGFVKSSQPGQFADNVLIANTCTVAESFDVKILLDARFETNPNNNPGNAVFTYATSGEVDPGTFAIQSFGTGKGQGQDLCLQNVTVQPNTSFLASVHSQVIKGISAATLGSSPFSFRAGVRTAGANCAGHSTRLRPRIPSARCCRSTSSNSFPPRPSPRGDGRLTKAKCTA